MGRKKLFLAILFVAAAGGFAGEARGQVIVIASPSVKAAVASKDDVRDIFSGMSSTLKDGSQATPVLLKASATQNEFLSTYIGKSDAAFRAGWRSLILSGQGMMPKQLDSEPAMVEYVSRTPGTIGYISASTPHEGVKVLLVR